MRRGYHLEQYNARLERELKRGLDSHIIISPLVKGKPEGELSHQTSVVPPFPLNEKSTKRESKRGKAPLESLFPPPYQGRGIKSLPEQVRIKGEGYLLQPESSYKYLKEA